MDSSEGACDSLGALGRFRGYLRLLAEVEIAPRFRRRLDPSDLVQETLLRACRSIDEYRGHSDGEMAAWLRAILAHTLVDSLREIHCAKRDVRRERSLEEALDRSSARLQVLAEPTGDPPDLLSRKEKLLEVADAIAGLPENWREALILKHWRGWSLAQIARHMETTVFSVTGYLRRALQRIREELPGE